uniref:ATPase inhibitor, mitochondrial n=1 Tax=Myotis myotis TaxID=51298 RepID=A0A7J7YDS8_MYOMY|nr:hypothetical protein mMyoMyo1_011051 [Myotis myotis]
MEKRPSRPVHGRFAFKTKWGGPELRGTDNQGSLCISGTSAARSVGGEGHASQRLWLQWSDNFSSKAGAIREAMGTFTKKEKAEEEGYFPERIKEQLAALKKQHEEEITHHKRRLSVCRKKLSSTSRTLRN